MTISRIQNIHVLGRDAAQLARFWQQALGLTLQFADEDRWIQLKAGDDSFAIASPGEGVAGQSGAVPVFEVDDLEEHAASIESCGGRVLERRDMGDHGRVLTFSDPEGNIAQLFTRSA